MSSNVLKLEVLETGEALGSSVFDKNSRSTTATVVIPQSKKKRRQSGEQRVVVPENTHTVKVRVTHTHRHTFSASKEELDLEREGAELISMAKKIKDQKEQSILGENSANVLDALSALSKQLEKAPNSTVEQKNDSDDDGLAHNNLEYGHQPIFPVFEDPWFDALNNHMPVENSTVETELDAFIQQLNAAPQPQQSTLLNNSPLKYCRISKKNLLVDVVGIAHRSFESIARLPTKRDFDEARVLVRVDGSKNANADGFYLHFDRMRLYMEEEGHQWARAYRKLHTSGNPCRSETGPLNVAEKTEMFVRCSEYRKHFFSPKQTLGCGQKLCGNYGMYTLLETPNLFVLPNSGVFGLSMQQVYGKPTGGPYGEFVDFERARLQLLSMDPFLSDSGWLLWSSCGNKVATCMETTMHNEVVKRDDVGAVSPNVQFYEKLLPNNCICEQNGTIVLCSNSSHKTHVNEQTCRPVPGKRLGSDNMCIVAADVFGPATRERWSVLRMVCGSMPSGRHDELLVKTFLNALEMDKHLCAVVPCLKEFGVDNQSLLRTGKEHDKKVIDRIGNRVRVQNNLPADSHGRERFYLYDPMEMTLALLLFVETRMTAGWFNVWRVWVTCIQTHCHCCPFCSSPLSESLYRFVVYNAMIPILPVTMATLIEQLALSIRCNRDMYR